MNLDSDAYEDYEHICCPWPPICEQETAQEGESEALIDGGETRDFSAFFSYGSIHLASPQRLGSGCIRYLPHPSHCFLILSACVDLAG